MNYKRSIPNILTISRGAITLIIIFLFFFDPAKNYLSILWLFLLASATDWLDGYLARKWQVISDFGKMFDPLFDKILTMTMYFFLFSLPDMPRVVFILLFLRELIVDGLKNYLLSKGIVTPAIKSAKLKTMAQIIMISLAMLSLVFVDDQTLVVSAKIVGWVAVALAYYSGGVYLRKFIKMQSPRQSIS